MAQSRLERVGTIYSRASGLIKAGALSHQDRPLWYDIYEAFPPHEEPRYDRPAPNIPLKKIFYEEDKIRAIFHRNNKQIGTTSLLNSNYKSLTQRFVETYKKVEALQPGATEEQLYREAVEIVQRERPAKAAAVAEEESEAISLSTAFKEAQSKLDGKLKINIANIFKDK